MNNTSNFNVYNVRSCLRQLNADRKNIQSNCGFIKKAYSLITLDQWDGPSRIDFHKKAFGNDDVSGKIGEMLSFCKSLNEILWNCAVYVSDVYNHMPITGAPLKAEDFTFDNIYINESNVEIPLASINDQHVAIPSDHFSSFASEINNRVAQIDNSLLLFNNGLKNLEAEIKDNTVVECQKQIQKINDAAYDFKVIMKELLEAQQNIAEHAQAQVNKTVSAQQTVTDQMSSKFQ